MGGEGGSLGLGSRKIATWASWLSGFLAVTERAVSLL